MKNGNDLNIEYKIEIKKYENSIMISLLINGRLCKNSSFSYK